MKQRPRRADHSQTPDTKGCELLALISCDAFLARLIKALVVERAQLSATTSGEWITAIPGPRPELLDSTATAVPSIEPDEVGFDNLAEKS